MPAAHAAHDSLALTHLYPLSQLAQSAPLCAAHAAPVAMLPLAHAVHSLSWHSRSLVVVSSTDSYWALVHTVWLAHVPHASCSSVGATFMYCVAEHSLTALHTRLTEADGAVIWHVTPKEHVSHAAQLVWRCPVAAW